MRARWAIAIGAFVIGSGAGWPWAADPTPAAAGERIEVVAAFYPLAEAAARVGRANVRVANVTPRGVEPHDVELSTREIDTIDGADVAVVMGDDFQPAVEQAAQRRNGPTLVVLEELSGRTRKGDPHVWLDPVRMIDIVDAVARILAETDEANAGDYRDNAARYVAELETLNGEFRAGLANCERRLIVTSHDAFGYLADAYDLDQQGVNGIDPNAEPNPKRLGQLADLARDEGVTTIFTEELISPRVARTVAREAGGLRIDSLSPLEGLTARQAKRGDDYLSVMRTNLTKLRRALGCA